MSGTLNQNNEKPPSVPSRSLKPRVLSLSCARHSEREFQHYRKRKISQNAQTVKAPRHKSLDSGTKLNLKEDPLSPDLIPSNLKWENHFTERGDYHLHTLDEKIRGTRWNGFVQKGAVTAQLDYRSFSNLQLRRNATCFELDKTVRGFNKQKRLHLLFGEAINE